MNKKVLYGLIVGLLFLFLLILTLINANALEPLALDKGIYIESTFKLDEDKDIKWRKAMPKRYINKIMKRIKVSTFHIPLPYPSLEPRLFLSNTAIMHLCIGVSFLNRY